MHSTRLRIPGTASAPAPISATVDSAVADEPSTRLVVACPPDPTAGGSRSDPRLMAVARSLTTVGIDCLRIDYPRWDGGPAGIDAAVRALEWGQSERAESPVVGLFGYSAGGGVAVGAAARADQPPAALSVLAPVARLDSFQVDAALSTVPCPVQVVTGTDDRRVDTDAILSTLPDDASHAVVSAGHLFRGEFDTIGELVSVFFVDHLLEPSTE